MNIGEKEIELIKEYLVEKISPYLIILFGSAAKGEMRKDSDIDIAFLSNEQYSDYDIFMIGQGLAGVIGRDVDLVDLNKASTVFQAQIVGTGNIIYNKDDLKRMIFGMTVLKKYARLNEERKCILDKVIERRRVYGD